MAFGPSDIELFNAAQWSKVDDLWVSNTGWQTRSGAGFFQGRTHGAGASDYHLTPPHSLAGGRKETQEKEKALSAGSGGNRAVHPFTTLELAEKAFKAKEISKKALKRLKRKFAKDTRKALEHGKKLKVH